MRSMLTHCTLTWATAAVAIALASASDSNGSGEAAGEASEIMQTLDSLVFASGNLTSMCDSNGYRAIRSALEAANKSFTDSGCEKTGLICDIYGYCSTDLISRPNNAENSGGARRIDAAGIFSMLLFAAASSTPLGDSQDLCELFEAQILLSESVLGYDTGLFYQSDKSGWEQLTGQCSSTTAQGTAQTSVTFALLVATVGLFF